MLTIVAWRWGSKYPLEYVSRLYAGLQRNLHQQFHFMLAVPEPEDEYLTKIPGCFCRLRMFDPEWQARNIVGDKMVCIDLDAVITGSLDTILNRDEPFVIFQGANASNPCPYNGSMWMLWKGYRPDVWTDFSLEAAQKIKFHEFPDDQGWFWHKLPDASGWRAGPQSGLYAYQKPGWPKGEALPANARAVFFPGWRDPSKFQHLEWVKEHWLK